MKQIIIYILLLLICNSSFAQNSFTGIAKYKLGVVGGTDTNTDSMAVVFDKNRVMIILYLPDGNKVSEKRFIDDFIQKKSFRVDRDKRSYEVDTLKSATAYEFVNSNGIGAAVNNELCFRYKAKLTSADKTTTASAECLGSLNYMTSSIKDYSFLGVQPIIVDNRIVMDFTVIKTNGTKPSITISNIRRIDNVDSYFDLWGYKEVN
ncbi:MAG: hypothetical protein ABI402_07250 [Ferruginibacter sp.]